MFTNKQLRALLVPLVIEQVLTALMGVADTFMVANVGEAAISGVSLVDSVNMLVTYFFVALAAGGTIVCAQYIGQESLDRANQASRQVMAAVLGLSLTFSVILIPLRMPLLRLIFGSVESAVMDAAGVYFLVTALSYPFLGLYSTSAALYRATGESKLPMLVALAADIMNIVGNAVLIFAFHMGVLGAAIATLVSRVFSAAVMLYYQTRPGQAITLDKPLSYRPDLAMIRRILRVGLPSAVENGMFQFGKLVVQATVSVLGTTAIAAQAIVVTLESFGVLPGQAIGIGLVTVAGQCMGRGRPDEARQYMLRFTKISTLVVIGTGTLVSIAAPIVTQLTGLSQEGIRLACQLTWFVSVLRVLLWPAAFTLPNGLRAAGDVSYTMWTSTGTMWIFRVAMSWYLCRYTPIGLWGVWIGWCTDWLVRAICYATRFLSGRWQTKKVLD